jgi:hypothetical protein
MRRTALGVFVAMLALVLPATAAAVKKQLVGNFNSPIQVFAPASVPGSTIYVVQKGGKIVRLQSGGHRNVVLDLRGRVSTGSEQGLLSGVISGRKLFVYYTNKKGVGDSRVARYTLNSGLGHAQPGSRKVVLRQKQPDTNHNGGTLQYRGGHLYLSLGDGGGGCDDFHNAQDLSSAGSSSATACATPGGGRSTARRGTSTSETLVRARVRRSTSYPPRRSASRPRTTAGTTTRAT